MKKLKSNSFHYWQWFAFQHQEELYEVIMSMIKNYVEEILPALIEKSIKEYVDKITVNVQTTLNGKAVDLSGLKEDIESLILSSLK